MRVPLRSLVLVLAVLAGSSCGAREPYPYPPEAEAAFYARCPKADRLCACSWDRITRTVTAEDYQNALTRLREEGIADPRLAQARLYCLDRT